jgi:DNA polymerase elongation subunit (family B)
VARLGALKTIEILQEMGIEVIYGDTDSVFFKLPESMSIEDFQRIVDEIAKRLKLYAMETFGVKSNPFVLNAEAVYSDMVILTKKHYCGRYLWSSKKGFIPEDKPEYNWKGLEIVRSDSSQLERDTLKEMLKMILNRETNDTVLSYWNNILSKLATKEYPLVHVSYPAKIKKEFEDNKPSGYKTTVPAHIKAAVYSNLYLGTDWRTSDKPRRVPISNKLVHKYPAKFTVNRNGKQPKEFKVNGIAIDEYYPIPDEFIRAVNWKAITKRITGKVNKILIFIGAKETEETKTTQTTLV